MRHLLQIPQCVYMGPAENIADSFVDFFEVNASNQLIASLKKSHIVYLIVCAFANIFLAQLYYNTKLGCLHTNILCSPIWGRGGRGGVGCCGVS